MTLLHRYRDSLESVEDIQAYHHRVRQLFLPQVSKGNDEKEDGGSREKGGSREAEGIRAKGDSRGVKQVASGPAEKLSVVDNDPTSAVICLMIV